MDEMGREAALRCLCALLGGEVPPDEVRREPWQTVLERIGDGHARRIDVGRPELAYWGRTWSARALAYVGDESTTPWLLRGLGDGHWRVRMTAAQTLGRLGRSGLGAELSALLEDLHPRVRAAAATALERTGAAEEAGVGGALPDYAREGE